MQKKNKYQYKQVMCLGSEEYFPCLGSSARTFVDPDKKRQPQSLNMPIEGHKSKNAIKTWQMKLHRLLLLRGYRQTANAVLHENVLSCNAHDSTMSATIGRLLPSVETYYIHVKLAYLIVTC